MARTKISANVGLFIGLVVVAGIATLVCVVGVIIFIQRRRQQSNPVRQTDLVVDRAMERLIGTEASARQALSPLLVQKMPPHNFHSHEPFDPYELTTQRRASHYTSRTEPLVVSDSEDMTLLREQQITTFAPSIPPIPSVNVAQPTEEEQRTHRASLSPRDLPPLVIPLSLKSRGLPTTSAAADSAVSPSTSPGPPDHPVHNAPPPSVSELSDSDSDTESVYSQTSASTRIYRDFERNEIPPPVPPLPIGVISQRLDRDEERMDETLYRTPTPVIVGLLKTRAQKSGPIRQLSRVSRIERSGSIVSHGGHGDEAGALPSRRNTKRRRKIKLAKSAGRLSENEPVVKDDTPSIVTLPNPFESAVSTPHPSPSTTLSSLPCERSVPSYRIEVTESRSFVSENVQPLRFSRGTLDRRTVG